MIKLKNAVILTPFREIKYGEVLYNGKTITAVGKKLPPAEKEFDLNGMYLAPGFIDLHIHGGPGYTFSTDNVKELRHSLKEVAKHGVTSVLPVTPDPNEKLVSAYKEVMHDVDGPELLGNHMEAIDQEHVYPEDDIKNIKKRPDYSNPEIYEDLLNHVPILKIIGVDPGLPGAIDMTRFFVLNEVKVSASHCGSVTYDQFIACVESGMDCNTHIYSGMSGFYRDLKNGARYPGLIEDCLMSPDILSEVIGDGIHLTGVMLDLIYKLKGESGIYLATDSQSSPAKLKPGENPIKTNKINGKVHIFSVASMDYVIKKTISCSSIPLLSAIRMATYNPAKLIGLENRKGKIAVGCDADFVVFDKDFNIHSVIARGSTIYNYV